MNGAFSLLEARQSLKQDARARTDDILKEVVMRRLSIISVISAAAFAALVGLYMVRTGPAPAALGRADGFAPNALVSDAVLGSEKYDPF